MKRLSFQERDQALDHLLAAIDEHLWPSFHPGNDSMDMHIVSMRSCFGEICSYDGNSQFLKKKHELQVFCLKTVLGNHFMYSGAEGKLQSSFDRIQQQKSKPVGTQGLASLEEAARGIFFNGILMFSTCLTSCRKGFGGKDGPTKHIN